MMRIGKVAGAYAPIVALALTSVLSAQAVLDVGPGGFALIHDAIQAAAPGDIIRVAGGTYLPFTCNKELTITALPGAQVTLETTFLGPACILSLPGGQARLRGLHFRGLGFLRSVPVLVRGGTVVFENCRWTGAGYGDYLLRVQAAAALLRNCSFDWVEDVYLEAPALEVENARIVAVDSVFRGSGQNGLALIGGPGIRASNTTLHLVRCLVVGGESRNISCFYPSANGLETDRGQWTWLVDSALHGGDRVPCQTATPAPGSGLVVSGTQPAQLTRTTVMAGVGPVVAPDIVGPTVIDQAIGMASPTTDIVRGQTYAVDYLTQPNAGLLIFVSFGLEPLGPVVTAETTWAPPGEFAFFGAVAADASGLAALQVAVPTLPALANQAVWLHAIDLSSAPLRVAPPVGGLLQ